MMRVTEIVRRENSTYISTNGFLDINVLSPQVARDLERYVKGRIALKKKLNQKKAISKKTSMIPKNDLAPVPFTHSRSAISQTLSREIRPAPGHLPVFSDLAPAYSMAVKPPEAHHLIDDRSASSSFYSGTLA